MDAAQPFLDPMDRGPDLIRAGRWTGQKEFVGPVPTDDRAGRHLLVQGASHLRQNGVPGLVADGRVVEIEPVDVEESHHQPPTLPASMRDQRGELLDHHSVVRQTRQPITSRGLEQRVRLPCEQALDGAECDDEQRGEQTPRCKEGEDDAGTGGVDGGGQ